jgi:cysteinyl-tRNA synthetase
MHNGFVNVDSEKMSKSLGNFFTIRDVVARYAPTALRFMLLGTHYRAAINYTQRALEEASDRMFYIYQTLADADAAVAADPSAGAAPPSDAKPKKAPPPGPAELAMALATDLPSAVATALDDDLNTPQALAALSAPLKAANDLLSTKQGRKARELWVFCERCK